MHQPLVIDFLYWDDCPSHERALALLQQVIQEEGVEAHIHLHQVNTDEEAEKQRFPGSPTIRIGGADIDHDPALPIGLTCRVYHHDNGKISPLPQKETIARAIQASARQPQWGESCGLARASE
jgi:hypothetical protein